MSESRETPKSPGPAAAGARKAAIRAAELDAAGPLTTTRERFVLDDTVYLDGNSLGALPRSVPDRIAEVIRHEWGELRIRSWTEAGWWTAPERIGEKIAPLVGAAPGQVVVGDSTSINVFKAVTGGIRMAGKGCTEILVDATTFPTDGYIARSAARMAGLAVRPVEPARIADEVTERTALALVNHVDYRTGELNDMASITAALHSAGALAVWDLCHSAGALPVALDACGVDLAVGCTYKYLNGGPGSPAYLYVRKSLQERFESPLPGWNSHVDPFGMEPGYTPADGVLRGRVGTPDILSMLALEAALEAWEGVAIEDVRAKSLALTDFFLECVSEYAPPGRVRSVTPHEHRRRGSQVSLTCSPGVSSAAAQGGAPVAGEVMAELIRRGVVGDFRPPDVLRFGFTPLYTTFAEAERAAWVLGEVLREHAAAESTSGPEPEPASASAQEPAAGGDAG
ncbi:kynureninase [Streptomyces noursei]|uniref:kynureninase n=1 Tax=Streptomyces noursei TaxID=1971 RepID=UPI001993A73D|nr:aminotransferase class V-fold PLP-dependent enzyme [Streptomyces noursei]GGX39419.1 kynureninase [Streptomyces noursei]